MPEFLNLVKPRFVPPLDAEFRPAVLANHLLQKEIADSGTSIPLVLGIEQAAGSVSRFETQVFPDDHPRAAANFTYVERLVKFLL
jgi:hypothetical protein